MEGPCASPDRLLRPFLGRAAFCLMGRKGEDPALPAFLSRGCPLLRSASRRPDLQPPTHMSSLGGCTASFIPPSIHTCPRVWESHRSQCWKGLAKSIMAICIWGGNAHGGILGV